jgi:hypothetical protein
MKYFWIIMSFLFMNWQILKMESWDMFYYFDYFITQNSIFLQNFFALLVSSMVLFVILFIMSSIKQYVS